MHWLPLVAMVIASALLFLRCPLPRLVSTTMEPGNNIRTSSSVGYDSDDSHQDFNSSANNTESAPHRTADTHNLKDNLATSSFKEPLSQRKQSQETLAAGGHSARTGDRAGLRPQGLKGQVDTALQDIHLHMDYKPQGVRFREDGIFEGAVARVRKNMLKERDNDRTRGRITLSKDRDKGIQGKKTLLQDKVNDGTKDKKVALEDGHNQKTLLKDQDSDGTQDTKTLLKDQDIQENSMVNQQLLDLPPAYGSDEKGSKRSLMPTEVLDLGFNEALQDDEELLLLGSNPRVLFTTSPTIPKHPPLQLLLESGLFPGEEQEKDEDEEEEHSIRDVDRTKSDNAAVPSHASDSEFYRNLLLGLSATVEPSPSISSQNPRNVARHKRHAGLEGRERAACESVSKWTDRKTATDFRSRNVTVIDFETKRGKMSQLFYETKCREPKNSELSGEHGLAGGECLGVDKKHWVSECRTKDAYVKAYVKGFTTEGQVRMFWTWIRIDSSCVCVLKSKTHKNQWQGQGTR
ncbi:uncharacterized protein [Hoplias malabaricus]|uniref:uncharacterized protein n=1 Tax=Hoplias malabaricus TaxID=27720 RepID=UPI0034635446